MSKQESKARVSRKVKRSKAKSSRKDVINVRAPFTSIVNNLGQVPVAYDIDISHTVHQSRITRGKKTGTLMYGRCPIAAIGYDSAVVNNNILDSYYSASSGYSEIIHLNPTEMFPDNSLEDRECQNYARFRFTELKIIAIGNTATNASTWFYLGYYPDGAVTSSDITDTFMRANSGTMKVATWNPLKSANVSNLLPDDLYYNDSDFGGGDSGFRQSYQGAITGTWVAAPGATVVTGELWIEYKVELWDPRTAADLALSSKQGKRVHKARGADKPREGPEELKFRLHFPVAPKNSELPDQKIQIAKCSPLPGPLRDPAPDGKEDESSLVDEPDPIAGIVRSFRVCNGKSVLVEQRQMSRSARLDALERALSAARGRSAEC